MLDHRKSETFPENIYFCFIDYAQAFDCVDHNKLWKILKEMDHLLEPDMEKQIGSNWESSKSRLYIVTLLI